MADDKDATTSINVFGEEPHSQKEGETESIGVAGVKISSGYILDDYLPELHGDRGRKKYREMKDGDATVGALISSIEMILRAVDFKVEASEYDLDGFYSDFMEEQFTCMDYQWSQTLAEILSMLVFGFAIFEMVYRKREDGLLETAKLAPRSQETIWEWDIDEHGDLRGVWQWTPYGGDRVYIDAKQLIHFKTKLEKGNPEGKSILRNAYKNYHYIKNIQMIEAIAIEREMAGLPIIHVPASLFKPENAAKLQKYVAMARDVKNNSQGGIVIPSTPYQDPEGKVTNVPQYKVELASASGSRAIDTSTVIIRHQQDMVRTVLADFIMLGAGDKGSFALSKSKADLFLKSIEGYLKIICDTLNDRWVGTLWALNAFPDEMKPKITTGTVAPVDLEELGNFIRNTGLVAIGDPETENYLREVSGLPKIEEGDAI